jgi:hypothetical protein
VSFCEGRVAPDSIYGVLHRECFNLFPAEMFADLFTDVGRRSVPQPRTSSAVNTYPVQVRCPHPSYSIMRYRSETTARRPKPSLKC